MKIKFKTALLITLIPFATLSQQSIPLKNIDVKVNEHEYLSFQNFSNDIIEIDVYGQNITLKKNSGAYVECDGNDQLELKFSGLSHNYFEVPCKSIVTILESFSLTSQEQ